MMFGCCKVIKKIYIHNYLWQNLRFFYIFVRCIARIELYAHAHNY